MEQQKTQHPSGTGGSGAWRDQLAAPAPDELAQSLEALRARVARRRRERWFGSDRLAPPQHAKILEVAKRLERQSIQRLAPSVA